MKPFALYISKAAINKTIDENTAVECGKCAIAESLKALGIDETIVVHYQEIKFCVNKDWIIYDVHPFVDAFQKDLHRFGGNDPQPVCLFFETANAIERELAPYFDGFVDVLKPGTKFKLDCSIHIGDDGEKIVDYRIATIKPSGIRFESADGKLNPNKYAIQTTFDALNKLLKNDLIRRDYS